MDKCGPEKASPQGGREKGTSKQTNHSEKMLADVGGDTAHGPDWLWRRRRAACDSSACTLMSCRVSIGRLTPNTLLRHRVC